MSTTSGSTPEPSGLWNAGYGEIGATLKVLQDRGVTLEHLERLRSRDHQDYADRVAAAFKQIYLPGQITASAANRIMRRNIFDLSGWAEVFGLWITEGLQRKEAAFPWSEELLMSPCPLCGDIIRECHYAFFGVPKFRKEPLTINKFRQLLESQKESHPRFLSRAEYTESFLSSDFNEVTTLEPRWYLLHLEIVPGSPNKVFYDQITSLPDEYEPPLAIAEVAKNTFARITRRINIYPHTGKIALCNHWDRAGRHVGIGTCDNGMWIETTPKEFKNSTHGIGASRKLPSKT